MNSNDWKLLISAYADNELSEAERLAAEKLLAEREECRAYLADLRRISGALKTVPEENLSPDSELKILFTTRGRSMKTTSWKVPAGIVTTLIVCVLVVNNYTKMPAPTGKTEAVSVEADQKQVVLPVNELAKVPGPVAKPKEEAVESKPFAVKVDNRLAEVKKDRPRDESSSTNAVSAKKEGLANGLQGRFKSAADDIGDQYGRHAMSGRRDMGAVGGKIDSLQYEPYYTAGKTRQEVAKGYYRDRVEYSESLAPSAPAVFAAPREGEYGFDQYYQAAPGNTEEYAKINDNLFKMTLDEALSTFSIDVDTASYAILRRNLQGNQLPPKDAVRIEEMINYFSYDYPQPKGEEPFSITTDLAVAPWNTGHQILRVGLKGKVPDLTNLPPSNLVFLIDVSGSMADSDKLPLLKEGYKLMVRQLRAEDRVAIVVYAGSAGQVLEPTPGDEKDKIIAALDRLNAGGSTAGGAGIQLAYKLAKENFIKGGNNRVVLATDGDFNVGVSSTSEMERLIEEKRQDGIFITVLGFGTGNIKDNRMETIADKGNGNYYYIDSIKEAKKVLVNELGSTLFTIAKDVKIQIEFNPAAVKAYRLIGYENRMLNKEDFNDDKKDAGEIGAGHTVTALYELVPADSKETFGSVDDLKYQKAQTVASDEVMTVKLRYKEPDADVSKLITRTISKSEIKAEPTGDFAWAAAVAEFGMLLRNSEHKGQASFDHVKKTAKANIGEDKFGLRAEFVTLVESAETIAPAGNGQINFK